MKLTDEERAARSARMKAARANGPLRPSKEALARKHAPEMLELLRGAGEWYCGELPDGSDRSAAIAALLSRIDGE